MRNESANAVAVWALIVVGFPMIAIVYAMSIGLIDVSAMLILSIGVVGGCTVALLQEMDDVLDYASSSDVERLDEAGASRSLPFMNFECPECGVAICEWSQCPECGWCDAAAWKETMQHYQECHRCDQTTAGYLCDDCDELVATDGGEPDEDDRRGASTGSRGAHFATDGGQEMVLVADFQLNRGEETVWHERDGQKTPCGVDADDLELLALDELEEPRKCERCDNEFFQGPRTGLARKLVELDPDVIDPHDRHGDDEQVIKSDGGLPSCYSCGSVGRLHKTTVEWQQANGRMTWRVVKACESCLDDGRVREAVIESKSSDPSSDKELVTDGGRNTRVGKVTVDDIDVYAGRGAHDANLMTVDPPVRGWLGNPFPVKVYGRKQAVEKYRHAFEMRLDRSEQFREAVRELSGKVLGCFCQRLDEVEPHCHAEIVAQKADELAAEEEQEVRADGGQQVRDDVFVKKSRTGRSHDVYHERQSCPILLQAQSSQPVAKDTLFDDLEPCWVCAGGSRKEPDDHIDRSRCRLCRILHDSGHSIAEIASHVSAKRENVEQHVAGECDHDHGGGGRDA